MSSGTLPGNTYHRAQSLGAGTYGSVITVYNDDGEEYALKLFVDDDGEEEETDKRGLDLGALRELSILRLLRKENGHDNIVPLVDIQTPQDNDDDDDDDEVEDHECSGGGAGTNGYLAMAMPLYKDGTLGRAIDQGLWKSCKRTKVQVAHGLLSAVAFLHDNGILHRDIKADNVMIASSNNGTTTPVLIDFSLAKLVNGTVYGQKDKEHTLCGSKKVEETETDMPPHTGGQGTPTYMAPEVVASQPYSLPSDLWSVGILLLELLQDHTLQATKNKEAEKLVEQAKQSLPDQPFANLVRGLLQIDPEQRLSARQALDSPLFAKFHLPPPPVRILDIHSALPLSEESNVESSNENDQPNPRRKFPHNKRLSKRQKLIHKIASQLDFVHPWTRYTALVYSTQLEQLEDTLDDDLNGESQSLLDCVLLAGKFLELDLPNLEELEEQETGLFQYWIRDEYYDTEETIWMLMDHCLYPRGLRECLD